MAKQSSRQVQLSPGDEQRQVLAKLQRIYGRSSVAPDVFGRRTALPSEIERLTRGGEQSHSLPKQPLKPGRQRSKQRA